MRGRMLLFILCLLIFSGWGPKPPAVEAQTPIEIGERLYYNVYIRGIYCGSQVFTLVGEENLNDYQVYHIQIKMDTARALGLLINYHEVFDIYLEKEELFPLRSYSVAVDKGKTETTATTFNQDGSVNIIKKKDGKETNEKYQVPPKVQDWSSLLYFLRKWPWNSNYSLQFNFLSSHGKITNVNIKNPFQEAVEVKAGKFSCYYLKDPALTCSVWLAAEGMKVPVRIFNQRPFGTIESRLVKIEKL